MKRAARLALGAVLALLPLCAAQPAAATHVQCGELITTDTTLDSDLLDCPADGLVIGARGITVDLNGHTIDGTASSHGIERVVDDEEPGNAPIRIEDGTVRDFLAGVKFEGDNDDAGPVTLSRVTLADNRGAAVDCFIATCNVLDSRAVGNGGGIQLGYGGGGAVERNVIADNRGTAVSGGGPIRDNRIVRNGSGIGLFEQTPRISGNLIADSVRWGVIVEFNGGGFIERNRILRNGSGGVLLDFAGVDRIEANTVADNGGPGLRLDEGSADTLVRNQILRNAGDGVQTLDFSRLGDVTGNLISRNTGNGVSLVGGEESQVYGGTFWDNVVRRNGLDGVVVGGNENLVVIEGNRTDRNGDDGIDVRVPATYAEPIGFSPDGRLFAFRAEGGIWVARPDGSGQRQIATDARDAQWSPDGSRIAFVHLGIWTVRPDGTGLTKLHDDFFARQLDWSADGSRIAFTGSPYVDPFVIDADGTDLRQLTFFGTNESQVDWSPDGTRVAFQSNRFGDFDIYTIRPDGTDEQRLTTDPADETEPRWSPAGTTIAFLAGSQLTVMAPDGSGRHVISPGAAAVEWSPSGDRLVYQRGDDVHTIHPDGTQDRLVAGGPGDERNPVWSPDGARIAFTATRGIGMVDADGANRTFFTVATTLVRDNRSDKNADLGIEAVQGTDGGGNRAKHNGDRRQCVGVVCRN